MNLDLKNQLREMQRQGVSRQEILRRQVAHSNQIARMKQNLEKLLFRKFGKRPTTGQAPFPVRPRVRPRSFASIFGSLYIYFVADDQLLGIFVGLWAPTLILISREVDKMMGWMAE